MPPKINPLGGISTGNLSGPLSGNLSGPLGGVIKKSNNEKGIIPTIPVIKK